MSSENTDCLHLIRFCEQRCLTLDNVLYIDPIDYKMPKEWSIIDQCRKRPPLGWKDQFLKWDKILAALSEDLEDESYFPNKEELFTAFRLTPLSKVRVVIVGQDPYADMGRLCKPNACGLSFSVRPGETPPPSLANIFKELKNDIKDFVIPKHGDLSYWASQGVLMLNKELTVRQGEYDSHKGWWVSFLNEVILALRRARPKTIFVLWGGKAQSLDDVITSKKRILKAAHPSPKSANNGFFGCKHFSTINTMLKADGETPIDWQI
jgi:uracil-DNA glycosylase